VITKVAFAKNRDQTLPKPENFTTVGKKWRYSTQILAEIWGTEQFASYLIAIFNKG
jgi:hypothetical protein